VEERVNEALDSRSLVGLTSVRGEVVRLLSDNRGALLTDGRQVKADIVVLAMGNLPPRPQTGGSGRAWRRPGNSRLRRHRWHR
jgi:hypothetical protein